MVCGRGDRSRSRRRILPGTDRRTPWHGVSDQRAAHPEADGRSRVDQARPPHRAAPLLRGAKWEEGELMPSTWAYFQADGSKDEHAKNAHALAKAMAASHPASDSL